MHGLHPASALLLPELLITRVLPMQRILALLLAMSTSPTLLAANGGYSPIPVPALSDGSLVGLAVIMSVVAIRLFRNRS